VNAKDTVSTHRQQMIKHIYDLLTEKSEQERTLLSLVINKFVRAIHFALWLLLRSFYSLSSLVWGEADLCPSLLLFYYKG
jgi:hypothetical protein